MSFELLTGKTVPTERAPAAEPLMAGPLMLNGPKVYAKRRMISDVRAHVIVCDDLDS